MLVFFWLNEGDAQWRHEDEEEILSEFVMRTWICKRWKIMISRKMSPASRDLNFQVWCQFLGLRSSDEMLWVYTPENWHDNGKTTIWRCIYLLLNMLVSRRVSLRVGATPWEAFTLCWYQWMRLSSKTKRTFVFFSTFRTVYLRW